MCQRKSLVLEKIAGSQWSCSNKRRNITYWSCFYPSCNFYFSSFSLVLWDLLQSRLLRLTTSAYAVIFGLNYFHSTGQVPNAAVTSQSFLTPPTYYSAMKFIIISCTISQLYLFLIGIYFNQNPMNSWGSLRFRKKDVSDNHCFTTTTI